MAAGLPGGAARGLDLGSGGGVPGLVLAWRDPGLEIVLLDAGQRRARFLRAAVGGLGLRERVTVVEDRAETAARRQDLRGQMDFVVARSFGPPAVTAECAVGFLRMGGVLAVSEPPQPERGRWPGEDLATLGFGPPEDYGSEGAGFVRMTREHPDDRWPRRVGIPAKRPLWR